MDAREEVRDQARDDARLGLDCLVCALTVLNSCLDCLTCVLTVLHSCLDCLTCSSTVLQGAHLPPDAREEVRDQARDDARLGVRRLLHGVGIRDDWFGIQRLGMRDEG